jgi:hypothetical protein
MAGTNRSGAGPALRASPTTASRWRTSVRSSPGCGAYRHWRFTDRAIRAGDRLPRPAVIAVLGIAITIVAGWALIGLIRA